MLLVNFMRQTVTKSCLRTVKPLHFAKFEKLYPVIFLVKYIKFFIINVGLQILLTQLLPLLLFGTNWRLSKNKKNTAYSAVLIFNWWPRQDSNLRPFDS